MFSGSIACRNIPRYRADPGHLGRVVAVGDSFGYLEYRALDQPILGREEEGADNVPPAVLFWGRLDNRKELRDLLGLQRTEPLPDFELLRVAWQRWGEALAAHLVGDFALAIVDFGRSCAFLARDPLGVKPLFYTRQREMLWFASSPSDLLKQSELSFTREPEWMARYLLNLSMSESRTAYRELFKLPPGHSLMLGRDGAETLRRYHHWIDDALWRDCRDLAWVEQYQDRLRESIRCRMEPEGAMASENSGGLDSATVTAYLAQLLDPPGDRLYSLGVATCEQEAGLILSTSRHQGIKHNYLVTQLDLAGDLDERIETGLRVLGYPIEHNVATAYLPFYRLCQSLGIRALFSGFGGDEVVTHSAHLLRRELLQRGHWSGLWETLPGRPLARASRLGRLIARERRAPGINPGRFAGYKARWPYRLVSDPVCADLGLERAFFDRASHDAPFVRVNDFIVRNTLSQPYISTRLESCTLVAAAYGVDYRWPLCDSRLIQQYLSTPAIEKMGPHGVGRYLHRRAVDGIVPRSITWKSSKDMGYQDMIGRMNRAALKPLARRCLALQANLAPELWDIVDQNRLRAQAERALAGDEERVFAFAFRRGVMALSELDAWLKGHGGG